LALIEAEENAPRTLAFSEGCREPSLFESQRGLRENQREAARYKNGESASDRHKPL
jgi:hypothetical protein